MGPRRGVAEAEAPRVGEDGRVQRLRNLRRHVQSQRLGDIKHQLAGGTGCGISNGNVADRFLPRHVMINHGNRHLKRTHGIGQMPQPAYVVDVEHDQRIDALQRRRPPRTRLLHIVAQEELKHRWPRRGIHNARTDPPLRQQTRQRRFRSAPVTIGIDVGGQCHRHARTEGGKPRVNVLAPSRGRR